jgi:hypothetical protein
LVIDTVLLTSWQIVDPLKIFKDISQTQVDDQISKKKYLFNNSNTYRQKMKTLLFYGFMKNVDQIVDQFG